MKSRTKSRTQKVNKIMNSLKYIMNNKKDEQAQAYASYFVRDETL